MPAYGVSVARTTREDWKGALWTSSLGLGAGMVALDHQMVHEMGKGHRVQCDQTAALLGVSLDWGTKAMGSLVLGPGCCCQPYGTSGWKGRKQCAQRYRGKF